MSLIAQAKHELALINFGAEGSTVMIEILEKFFDEWDSGGAVYFAAPVLQKLIAGLPLTPLTGEDDEWFEIEAGVFQNKRMSSVFKDTRFKDDPRIYDIGDPLPRKPITLPYTPPERGVSSPVVETETK